MPTHAVWVTPGGGTFGVHASGWNSTLQEFNGIFWLQRATPQKEADYNDLWGLSYDQVWAVSNNATYDNGTNATVVGAYFNGATWSNRTLSGAPSGAFAMLNAVYGESISSIYAAGMANGSNGTAAAIFAYSTGSGSWWVNATSPYNDGALFGVWSAGGRVWAVGENGTIVRYDAPSAWNSTRFTYNNTFAWPDNGATYTTSGYHLNGIWGTNSTNFMKIFAVGEGGVILQYIDGAPVISSYMAAPNFGTAPLAVTLACSASDTNGTITSYRWDVDGDGVEDFVTGPANSTLNYTYAAAGTYNSSVTVVDDSLLSAKAYATVTVNPATNATNASLPPTLISFVANPERGIAPLPVLFTFTASDDNGAVSYRLDVNNDGSPEFFTPNATSFTWTYNNTGTYVANGTVYDQENQTASAIRHITVTSGSPPVVSGLSATPLTGEMPLAVTFTITASDADGDLVFYDFDFDGDGTYDRAVNSTLASSTTYTYRTSGTFAAKARARDRLGNSATSSSVSITSRPAKVAGASNQSAAVASVTVNTQDTFPMSSSSLISNYRIAENNFTSLADVREFTSAVAPATGVPATYCYKFSGVSQNIAELRLYKLAGATNIPFRYVSAPAPDTDGAWWITTEGGAYLSPTQSVTASNVYQVYFVIRDNGPYDLDAALGSIRDPQVLGLVPLGGGGGGGGSGGGGGGGGGGGCTLSPEAQPSLELVLLLGLAILLLSLSRSARRG
ncbi:MAG: PKD domain-containing protein [Thermodesulfobacteriota bacterium]